MEAPAPGAGASRSEWRRLYLLVAASMGATAVFASAGPIGDIDAYWHVRLGEEILSTGRVTGIGDAWAWYDPPQGWTTSQWIAEAAMAAAVRQFSWHGLVYGTAILTGVLALVGYFVARARATLPIALIPYSIFVLLLVITSQPRPALVSLLGLLLVAHVSERVLMGGPPPRWWSAPLVALWANIHGLWVVAPAALALAASLIWLGKRPRPPLDWQLWAVVGSWIGAGLITPLGLRGLTLPFDLRGSTGHIQEWQVSTPWTLAFVPLGLVITVLLWASRRSPRLRRWEVAAWVVVWVLFSLPVLRNVIVSTIMLVPLVATVCTDVGARSTAPPRPPLKGLVVTAGATLATLVALSVVRLATVQPLEDAQPLQIARHLAATEGAVRILNDYNAAGVLIAFGPSEGEVAIDGRAERYGAEYIDKYLDLLAVRDQDWPSLLQEIDPDVAVVEQGDAIRYILQNVRGWQLEMVDDPYVLLRAPREGER